ncbi:MAG: transposase [Deltaproteobacteria bacterium]|nr:transposase [Deltaproteobacteria bacterium]
MGDKQSSNPDAHGFEPVDPWKSQYLGIRRRNLPHLVVPGATYFITFRANIELSPAARDVVIAIIHSNNQKSIDLDACVVMPDHAHFIFRPIEPHQLPQLLQRIKGRSAREINQMLKRGGSVWGDESFDHIIRHAEELAEKIEYIRNNPVKRGLVKHPEAYKWSLIKNITG